MRVLRLALAVTVLAMAGGVAQAQVLRFDDLEEWAVDDHAAALSVFVQTCDQLDNPDWGPVCALARDTSTKAARSFFELMFRPVLIGSPPALFTGYYEPELAGSPVRTPRFAYPIYRRPPEMSDDAPWLSRQEIEGAGMLQGRGLELAWLEDPVEAYFLQIQGSGRIRMPDGRVIRVGYAGKNNQPYRSIGQELIRRGLFEASEVSADVIQDWVRRYPAEGRALMNHNPSFVFFRKIGDLAPDKGPIGAMGRSITAMRSIAIDPAFVPLGAPVWVEKNGAGSFRRLMIAQDTGGAIKGAQRADIFYGTGRDAGQRAGQIKDGGRMIVLLPIERAYAMLSDGPAP
ncbi:MAG: murein transglycosylase [Cereibacter sphaeroides]|uniref:peptidoglycan lytic exotransglycosylase n=1 Tax=Cereibacter sphaeroides TaxID=1063 RepID=A0A2W5SEH2_CERSP|nr:MAG: murein transglycosylase [Cereibacter sphaeroides]